MDPETQNPEESIREAILEDHGLTPATYAKGYMAAVAFGGLVVFGFLFAATIVGVVVAIPMWIGAILIAYMFPMDDALKARKQLKLALKAHRAQKAVEYANEQ